MKKSRQELNREINLLYRQLGKEIFEADMIYDRLNKQQKKIVKNIQKRIEVVATYANDEMQLNSEAIILDPETNEDGLKVLSFCPYCGVGNNPNSTHCIQCNKKL